MHIEERNDTNYHEFGSVELERCKKIDHGTNHVASNVRIMLHDRRERGLIGRKKAFEE